ncbi:MAG TPA: transporter substrate-binding domain-containing protein [Candidatus Limnocylindrales bacterium]|jgi:polar amino acid transport system substrate-binding protein
MRPDDLERRLANDPTGDPPFPLSSLTTRLLDEDGARPAARSSGMPVMSLVALAILVIAVVAVTRAGPRTDQVVGAIPDDLRALGQVTVAVSDGSPQLQSAAGVDGFDVDVADELGRRLGLRVRIVAADPMLIASGPWPDDWDLALASTASPGGLPAGFDSGAGFARRPGAVIVRAADEGKPISALAGSTLCAVRGGIANAWLDAGAGGAAPLGMQVPSGIEVTLVGSFDECLADLRAGIVDAAVVDFAYDQLQPGPDFAVLRETPFTAAVVPIAQPADRGRRELLALVDSTLRDMRTDGTLSRLSMHRFGGLDLSEPP